MNPLLASLTGPGAFSGGPSWAVIGVLVAFVVVAHFFFGLKRTH